MSKKVKGFSIQGFDSQSIRQTEAYARAVDQLYNQAVDEFTKLATRTKRINPDKPFAFKDYPETMETANKIASQLASKMKMTIESGSRNQWLFASKKGDAFLDSIMNTSKLSKPSLSKLQDRNLDALETFQKRKVDGMDLSKRVWRYTNQFKDTMEMGIDVGLGEGRSAQQLSRDLRKNLVDPDRLFRRVRDKHGQLQLSKAAKAFKPGQGVYRSSYKNAMRLTRSEINMAYKVADQMRWRQLDFVVGIEIKLSNNHTLNGVPFVDICDRLVGRYPKNFLFKGWHPQCRCLVIPVLQSPEEFDKDELNELKSALKGTEYKKYASKNTVKDVPDNFKQWVKDHKEISKGWKSKPYFIRDNFKYGNLSKGLKVDVKPTIVAPKPTKKPTIKAKSIVDTPKIKPSAPKVSKHMPNDLAKESVYLKGTNIEFRKEFFDLIDPNKPITLRIENSKGSYFMPGKNLVHIAENARNRASDWHRESVVYHEYGHAIDTQRGLCGQVAVKELMNKHQALLRKRVKRTVWNREYDFETKRWIHKKVEANQMEIGHMSKRLDDIHVKIRSMSNETFKSRGITKHDVLEQIGSVQDTIKSINIRFGWGHSTAYFKRPGMRQMEFIAHAFENAFAGNAVFKKYLPDLYKDMIEYVNSLK